MIGGPTVHSETMPFLEADGHSIEYETIPGHPTIVFLHEGLGSVGMWKDFPRRLADAAHCGALVYSRYGYGRSEPIREARTPDFMHREAQGALPDLLHKLGIERPILFGHSDGASIALIHAATHPVRGAILLAPHLFVEEISLASIREIDGHYDSSDLKIRLARYHADPDSAFRGWSNLWLHPEFRDWNIENFLPSITAPVLAVQGIEDQYGTMEHLDRIAQRVPGARLLKLPDCRHSPHLDQPDAVIDASVRFIETLGEP
jgi:pimeloyl-ACP methyl ester carboxylesterase